MSLASVDSPLAAAPSTVADPVQRLEQSRERMRQWLDSRTRKASKAPDGRPGTPERMSAWVEEMRGHPLAAAVIDGLHSWWVTHPLHSAWRVADETADDLIVPFVRRHPVGVALGAFAIGVLSARFRAWRWVVRPALFAGLASHLTSRLMSHGSLEFMLGAIQRFTARMNEQHPPQAAAAESPPTSPASSQPFTGPTATPPTTSPSAQMQESAITS